MAEPSLDLGRIKRNAKRMAEQGAPENEIDDYVKTEGTTFEQLSAFKGFRGSSQAVEKDADLAEKTGAGGFNARFADNISFGAFNPIAAGLTAAGKTAYKAATGKETDIVGDYKHERDVQDELLRRAREGTGIGGTAAEIGLSLPFVAPGAITTAGAGLVRQGVDAALTGAKYGAIYGANSARGGVEEHVGNTASHGAVGAIAGPILHYGLNALARAPGAVADAVRSITGRTAPAVAENAGRLSDFANANVREFGPEVGGGVSRFVGKGLTNSLAGSNLRAGAQETIDDITRNAQNVLGRYTEGQPVSDVGAGIKNALRYNLAERSVPQEKIAAMSEDDLTRLTGPIDQFGFAPPRPKVDPIPPRDIAPVAPQPVDPNAVPFEAVKPAPVVREPPRPQYPPYGSAQPAPELVAAVEKADNDLLGLQAQQATAFKEFEAVAQAHGMPAETLWRQVAQARPGMFDEGTQQAFAALRAANETLAPAEAAVAAAKKAAAASANDSWRASVQGAHAKASADADAAYAQNAARAAREAEEGTRVAREKAVRDAEMRAQETAAAETARLRAEAEAEAAASTKRAQAEAEARYEAERKTQPGFELGRSRETYPSEYSAAEELLARNTPTFQRNPFGGKGMSGSPYKTATEDLMDGFAKEARRAGRLPGYKEGSVFGSNGIPRPDFLAHMTDTLGKDVSDRLQALMLQRIKSQPAGGPQALRELITAVRRERQNAQQVGTSPKYPGQPMPERAAALSRLEGALNEDFYKFLGETGPQGDRIVAMTRNVRGQYREHLETVRKPLARLYGDNVRPIEAMDRLLKAAQSEDLATLRPFVRVMMQKDDPTKAAAAIVSHATNGANSLNDLVTGLASIPPASRDTLFQGTGGRALRTHIETLERLAIQMKPYERAIAKANEGGLKISHVPVGIAMFYHAVPAILTYGGAAGVARFMSSPRYVKWLTDVPKMRSAGQLNTHIERLGFATGDTSEDAKSIRKGVKAAAKAAIGGLAPPANAASPDAAPQDSPDKPATPEPADIIGRAAQKKGLNLQRAKPQDVIDAAWEASPTDEVAEAIEIIAKQHNLLLPWN